MDKTTNSNQPANASDPSFNPQFTGMPTKHSLLSAQADLNTNSFSKNPIPDNLPHTTVPASSSLGKPVTSAAPTAAPATSSAVSFGSTASVPASTVSTAPVTPIPAKPVTPSSTGSASFGAATTASPSSTSPSAGSFVGSSPIGQTMGKPMQQPIKPNPTIQAYSPNYVHPGAGAPKPAAHEVVFADSPDTSIQSASPKAHHRLAWSVIATIVLVALLGGGFYYWYFNMGGKAMIDNSSASEVAETNSAPVAPSAPTAPVKSAFPAVVTQPTSVKPTKPASTYVPAEDTSASDTFGSAEKEKISAYIAQNINRLSPIKSADSFAVTDINFDGPNRALVSYSNSQYSISAVANVYFDKSGAVKVSSFTILEK